MGYIRSTHSPVNQLFAYNINVVVLHYTIYILSIFFLRTLHSSGVVENLQVRLLLQSKHCKKLNATNYNIDT